MTWAEQVAHFRKQADLGMFDNYEETVAQKRLHERGGISMPWTERIVHMRDLVDRGMFDAYDRVVEQKRELHARSAWQAADNLSTGAARMLLARGPEFARSKLEPISGFIAPAVEAYVTVNQGDDELTEIGFELGCSINVFEVLGFRIDPKALASFGACLARLPTNRKDPQLTPLHWIKGLAAIACGQILVWKGIAGLRPDEETTFTAGEAFGPNVQGLVRYLGAARKQRATLDDVAPAWRSFMTVADTLHIARQIDNDVILWVARIVFHHIGGEPLGSVAGLLYDESQRMVAAGL